MFLATSIAMQQEVKIEKGAQNILIQKISNLVETGEDNISYKKAVEKENKEYNQENDEYIKEIDANLASTYGDDYYAYATVSAILQIVDTSLAEMESIINKSFNIDIELEDAFSVQVNQVVRGKLNSTSEEMEYLLIKVDGKYYLYDQYYETA